MSDFISRRTAIKAIEDLPNCYNGFSDTFDKACIIGVLEEVPSAQPTLYGYNIEHLVMIASVMRKEGVSPEEVLNILRDSGRLVEMVIDEMRELSRVAWENLWMGNDD